MVNILFDCERMKYFNTGLYFYCLNLGRAIQNNLDPTIIRPSFYTPGNGIPYFGMNACYSPQNSLHKFWKPSLKGFDIWHCTYQNSDYLPHRDRKIKVILTIHDLNFIYQNKPDVKKGINLKHLQKNIDRSDAIVCVSEYTRNDVLKYCDIKNKQLTVIHNGANSLYDPILDNFILTLRKNPFSFHLAHFTGRKTSMYYCRC